MVGFIIGIIVIILGIVFGAILLTREDLKTYSILSFLGGPLLGLLLIFFGCICSVPTGHTGVITVFGRVKDETLDAGFHTKAPWESVVDMDNRVQKQTVELSCFSSDIQEVRCKYTINYQINKANAQTIYKTIGPDYYIITIYPTVAEAVKVVIAKYTAEELIGARENLAATIENDLSLALENFNIEVVSTAIEDIDFTDSFTNAVESKQVADQRAKQVRIEQEQAKMEAQYNKEIAEIQANAAAEVARIAAEADLAVQQINADAAEYTGKKEAAITLQALAGINGWSVVSTDEGINQLYKPDGTVVTDVELKAGVQKLIEYYYTQSWNGILPSTYVGDGSVSTVLIGGE